MAESATHENLAAALQRVSEIRKRVAASAAPDRVDVGGALAEVETMLTKLKDDVRRLDLVLAERAVDIERLRSTMAHAMLTEERLRHALASELQSSLGQYIALAKLRLATLRATSDTDLRLSLAHIESLIESADHSLRVVTLQISPPSLYDLGLVPALEWLAEEVERRFGVAAAVLAAPALPELVEERRVLLYRCAREMLMEIAQHAHARSAVVEVSVAAQLLTLCVSTPAPDFDVASGVRAVSRLFGAHEALRHVGGSLTVRSSARHGTSLCADVPLGADLVAAAPLAAGGE